MTVRLSIEAGPGVVGLEQLLEIDVDDLLEVLERVGESPVTYLWHLPNGTTIRLRAWRDDTPQTSLE